MEQPKYVYVASSWRCAFQPAIVAMLASLDIPHYDFRNPPNKSGFGWEQVAIPDPCSPDEYLQGIQHPIAEAGYAADYQAMVDADTFVLVLPCGRSAHLELGWAVGQGKRTAILLEPGAPVTPELMYKMVDHIAPDLNSLMDWLGVPR